jgi:hypothetical protein
MLRMRRDLVWKQNKTEFRNRICSNRKRTWKLEFRSLEQAQETNREDDCHKTAGMGSIKDQNLEFCVQEEETNLIIRRETHTQKLSESNRIQKHITNWSMGFLGTRVSMPISPPHTG